MDTLSLKIGAPGVLPVVLENERGIEEKYELREMSAASREKYLDQLTNRLAVDSNGKPKSVSRFEGMQAALLTKCLFKIEGEIGVLVKESVIQAWPALAVSQLFSAAQQLNDLGGKDDKKNDKKEEEPKND